METIEEVVINLENNEIYNYPRLFSILFDRSVEGLNFGTDHAEVIRCLHWLAAVAEANGWYVEASRGRRRKNCFTVTYSLEMKHPQSGRWFPYYDEDDLDPDLNEWVTCLFWNLDLNISISTDRDKQSELVLKSSDYDIDHSFEFFVSIRRYHGPNNSSQIGLWQRNGIGLDGTQKNVGEIAKIINELLSEGHSYLAPASLAEWGPFFLPSDDEIYEGIGNPDRW